MNKQHINISKATTKKKQPANQGWGKDNFRKGLGLDAWTGMFPRSSAKLLGNQEGSLTTKRNYHGPVEG